MPPGGQTVMNPHGRKRLTPAFLAAFASGIWSSWLAGPIAETTISMPWRASTSSSSGPEKSAGTMSTPRSLRARLAFFDTEEGRVKAVIDYIVCE